MAGTPVPWLAQQFSDNSGVPLSGGRLATFLAGTTTPAPLYTDSDLLVPYPNPLILDSAGRPPGTPMIYMPPTSYKFQLNTSANVLVWVIDRIPAVPANEIDLDIQATAGESLAVRDVAFVADGTEGGTVAGRWYKADADFANRSTGPRILGIVPSAIASGATGAVRIQGRVTGFSGLTPGAAYYVSAVAGAITTVVPVNARFVGIADTTTTLLLSMGAAADLNPILNTLTVLGTSNLNGNIIISNVAPEFDLIETDGAANAKRWLLHAQSGSLFLRTTEDVPATFPTVFEITRSGVTPTGFGLNVPLRLTGVLTPPALAIDEDDYNPPGLATANRLRLSPSGAIRTLTGLAAQADGHTIALVNIGLFDLILATDNPGSLPANRFAFGGGGIQPGGMRFISYDLTLARWVVGA